MKLIVYLLKKNDLMFPTILYFSVIRNTKIIIDFALAQESRIFILADHQRTILRQRCRTRLNN